MECLHPDRACPFARWVERDGRRWLNCFWSCPYDRPFEPCAVSMELRTCIYRCIFEAIEDDSDCPHKEELKKGLEELQKS